MCLGQGLAQQPAMPKGTSRVCIRHKGRGTKRGNLMAWDEHRLTILSTYTSSTVSEYMVNIYVFLREALNA